VIIVFFEIVVLFVERTVDDNSTMTEVKRRYPVRPREGSTRIFAGHPSICGESEVCDYGYTGQALLQTVQTARPFLRLPLQASPLSSERHKDR